LLHFQSLSAIENGGTSLCRKNLWINQRFCRVLSCELCVLSDELQQSACSVHDPSDPSGAGANSNVLQPLAETNNMHCSHCKSLMVEVGVQRDDRTEQTLYECPVCQRTQLVTRTLHQWRSDSMMTCRFANRALRQV
jgi:hypothetical protein